MNWLSKNPKLSTEKFLVFGALAIYLFRHTMLQKKGQLGNEPPLLLKIDKSKVFEVAKRRFNLSDAQTNALEGIYDHFMDKGNKV